MVATLVIMLPSSYQGGELVVRHDGQEQTIDFSGAKGSSFLIHFAAFYADCEHEIRPLQSGYRLCLVYNLTLAKAKKPLLAPRSTEHVERVRQILNDWSNGPGPRKLAVTLAHQYTQDGLTWDALKGVDRTKAWVLREAARQSDCHAYLAQLTFWESGAAEYNGEDYGYSHGYDEDEEDENDGDEDGGSEHVMGEVFDSSLTAEHWTDADGQRLELGKMAVEEDELLDPQVLRKVKPKEDYEGYTGNEGMTLERWYRHAVVLLWPENRHFEVLCDCGNVVPALKRLVASWRKAKGGEAAVLKEQCRQFARHIIARWGAKQVSYAPTVDPSATELLKLLARLDDPALIGAYLGQILAKDVTADPADQLTALCTKHGWLTFQKPLEAAFQDTTARTLGRNARILEQLCLAEPGQRADWVRLCVSLSQKLLAALEGLDAESATNWQMQDVDRGLLLANLARSLLASDQEELLARFLTRALARPKEYPLTEAHVAALSKLQAWLKKTKPRSAGLARWLAECCRQLESLTAQAPRAPTDFRRAANVACQCKECQALKRFLQDPHAEVARFRVRQELRDHLETKIEQHHCDVACKTDRGGGSPHALVCTKTTASYRAAVEKFDLDEDNLVMLRAIQARLPAAPKGTDLQRK
jgi:hypothetical protein